MNEKTSRNLLKALGVGDFQATMVIPNLYQSPAVQDPKSAHTSVIVSRLQDVMNGLGMNVGKSGVLDVPTANALASIVGPGWERMTWADNIAAVLSYAKSGPAAAAADAARASAQVTDYGLSGITDSPSFLPSIPGGYITYGVAAYLLYRYFKKGKSAGGAS